MSCFINATFTGSFLNASVADPHFSSLVSSSLEAEISQSLKATFDIRFGVGLGLTHSLQATLGTTVELAGEYCYFQPAT